MKIVLLNIDKFVKANELKEITNPIPLDRGYVPTPDGLLSTEIFGTNMKDRRTTFAYITLNGHFFQPIVYKAFKRLDRRIESIVAGTKNYKIDKDGNIVEDENGDTGIEWLYKNWSKISFKRNYSKIRGERIDMFEKHTRDELFQDKEIVVPAFFRDINLQNQDSGKPSMHEINGPYSKLIRLAMMLNQGDFTFNLNYTRLQIQNTLVEIYNYFKARIEKKRGIIKQSILGKSVDYGLRVVIAAPKFTYNKVEDMPIDFYHSGIPLSYCVSLFTPFFTGWVQKFFQRECEMTGMKYPVYDGKTKSIRYVKLKDPIAQFNDEYVKKLMSTFIYSYGDRFNPIYLETEEKGVRVQMRFRGRFTNDEDTDPNAMLMKRPFTLTDLFFMAADDITRDKHVYITRYPLSDHLGIFPNRIHVLSTHETEHVWIDGKEYKYYPKVDVELPKEKVSVAFVEVLRMSNVYLKAINGDYDGDQVTAKGVYSQEANAEAERIMKSLTNILSVNGSNIRTTTIEAIQTLYMMSRWGDNDKK